MNSSTKTAMSKDDLNVGDGKRMKEDLNKMNKKEEEASLKMKRKPPKELMKGGIRDRSLFSWIRILGCFFSFTFFLILHYPAMPCSVAAAIWWAFIIGFLAGCFALMCVFFLWIMSLVKNYMQTIRYVILYGSEEDSKAPYFVRNQNKYPDLLYQPGIKIDCVSICLKLLFRLE